MLRSAVVVVVVLCACGRIRFDPDPNERQWINRDLPTPGVLSGARAVFHPKRGTVLLYGGDTSHSFPPGTPSAAMWEYDGVLWTRVCDPCELPGPGPRFAPAMAYDIARDRIVLFGGADTTGALDTMYEWDGAWTEISPAGTGPGKRVFAQMAYDELRRRVVMFGGGSDPASHDAGVFEYDGSSWSSPTVAGPGPGALGGAGAAAAWNPSTARIDVLEDGGHNKGRDSAWSWDGASWSLLCANCTGTRRRQASIVVDASRPDLYITGGYDEAMGTELPGTWKIDDTGSRMISSLPAMRDSSAVAYDAARDVFVLYGGNGRGCGGFCSETWELTQD